jgi:hypothetical protein
VGRSAPSDPQPGGLRLWLGEARIPIGRPDARIVATALRSRPGEAGLELAQRLHAAVRLGSAELRLVEEEENVLRLALAEVERDGYSSPELRELQDALLLAEPVA